MPETRLVPVPVPVPASRWAAEAFLRVVARLRRFDADQIALQQRWLQRYGMPTHH